MNVVEELDLWTGNQTVVKFVKFVVSRAWGRGMAIRVLLYQLGLIIFEYLRVLLTIRVLRHHKALTQGVSSYIVAPKQTPKSKNIPS